MVWFLSTYAVSCVAYEFSRLILVSYGDRKMPWYMSALSMVLTVVGCLAMFTIGIIHSQINKIIYGRHIEQMKKLRTIAELQGYPDSLTEKRYNLDCKMFDHGGEFNICLWKKHEYEKLGL